MPPRRSRSASCEQTLRDWALHAAVVVDETPVRERIGAASLVVGRVDRAILEWLARHPWLTTVQLASLTGVQRCR